MKWIPILAIFVCFSHYSVAIGQKIEIGKHVSPLKRGYVTEGCDWDQQQKLKKVHDVLFEIITTRYADFMNCVRNAPVVEFSCHRRGNPNWAGSLLKEYDAYTTMKCTDLGPRFVGRARVKYKWQ